MTDVDHTMSRAVKEAYRRGQEEESMEPLVRVDRNDRPVGRVVSGDEVVFYDIRGEREVELTQAFVEPSFAHFAIEPKLAVGFTTMIEYDRDLPVSVAFPPEQELAGTLSETVSSAGLTQVKVTETEKAIHLAYFLNGKRKAPFAGESRVTHESPSDPFQAPEMRAAAVAASLEAALEDPTVDLVIGNLPNIDVVGHGEDRAAIIRAVAAVDQAIGLAVAAAERVGATALLTADHGTVEDWLYPEGTVNTGHTASPVPCVLVEPQRDRGSGLRLRGGGGLVDVAPTVLELLGIPAPPEMTGRSLVIGERPRRRKKVLLLVCDGWGLAAPGPGNLITEARPRNLESLLATCPHIELQASGEAVGLPAGTVGNSEAGHLHIGAGRPVWSDKVRIARALQDGSFFANPALLGAAERARSNDRALHLLGIVSFFSSHGSVDYLLALLDLAKRQGLSRVFAHGLLGRRGERPESGAHYVEVVEREMARLGVGTMASVIGRYWALDREHNWDRVARAYDLLVGGRGRSAPESHGATQ